MTEPQPPQPPQHKDTPQQEHRPNAALTPLEQFERSRWAFWVPFIVGAIVVIALVIVLLLAM